MGPWLPAVTYALVCATFKCRRWRTRGCIPVLYRVNGLQRTPKKTLTCPIGINAPRRPPTALGHVLPSKGAHLLLSSPARPCVSCVQAHAHGQQVALSTPHSFTANIILLCVCPVRPSCPVRSVSSLPPRHASRPSRGSVVGAGVNPVPLVGQPHAAVRAPHGRLDLLEQPEQLGRLPYAREVDAEGLGAAAHGRVVVSAEGNGHLIQLAAMQYAAYCTGACTNTALLSYLCNETDVSTAAASSQRKRFYWQPTQTLLHTGSRLRIITATWPRPGTGNRVLNTILQPVAARQPTPVMRRAMPTALPDPNYHNPSPTQALHDAPAPRAAARVC